MCMDSSSAHCSIPELSNKKFLCGIKYRLVIRIEYILTFSSDSGCNSMFSAQSSYKVARFNFGERWMDTGFFWSGEISCPILIPHSVSALICSIAVHTLFIGEFVNSANRASPAHISEESRNQTYDTWLDLVSAPVWCPDVRSIHYLLEWTLKHKSVPALAQFLFSNW